MSKEAFGGLQLGFGAKFALINHRVNLSLFVLKFLPKILEDLSYDESLVFMLIIKIAFFSTKLFEHAL